MRGTKDRVNIEAHLLTHDGEVGDGMLPWSVRHYLGFVDKLVIHDGGPNCESTKWIRTGRYHSADEPFVAVECREWSTGGQLNDQLAMHLKNTCWRGTRADVVIVADCDELIHSNKGTRARLERAFSNGAAVLKPHGFEMFSDVWWDAEKYPGQQLTDLVKDGSPDDKWYAKSICLSPRLVHDSGFGIGAHESRPILRDGRGLIVDKRWPFAGDLALLHFKSIFGGMERIARRYDETRKRLSAVNLAHGWGNMSPGNQHAQEKRDLLLPGVRRVIP